MTTADAFRLAKALKALGETFNEPVSDVRADAYLYALEDFSIEQVEQACLQAIRFGKFFPRPAELRTYLEGDRAENATLAWADLLAEVRRVGHTGRPQLSAANWATVERLCGSWVRLCETLPGEGPGLTVWQKRFQETYLALASRERLGLPEAPARPQLGPSPALVADGDT